MVLPLGAIENLWENDPAVEKNGYNLVDCPPKATKLRSLNPLIDTNKS